MNIYECINNIFKYHIATKKMPIPKHQIFGMSKQ